MFYPQCHRISVIYFILQVLAYYVGGLIKIKNIFMYNLLRKM